MNMKKITLITSIIAAIFLSGCGVRVEHDVRRDLNVEMQRYDYIVKTYVWNDREVVAMKHSFDVKPEDLEKKKMAHRLWGEEKRDDIKKCLEDMKNND